MLSDWTYPRCKKLFLSSFLALFCLKIKVILLLLNVFYRIYFFYFDSSIISNKGFNYPSLRPSKLPTQSISYNPSCQLQGADQLPRFLKQRLFRHYASSFNEFRKGGGTWGVVGELTRTSSYDHR